MNIGDNLVRLREAKGLKQYELANIINVSDKTISSYENNRSLPNIEMLVLIANALDTNIDTILGLTKENVYKINKVYENKNCKENIIKFIFLAILFIIPIIYFYCTTAVVIGYFTALIYEHVGKDIIETSNLAAQLNNGFIITYLLYLLFVFINYIFYKKKLYIPILVINGIIFIIFTLDLIINGIGISFELLLFPLVAIFGIIISLKKLKIKNNNKK